MAFLNVGKVYKSYRLGNIETQALAEVNLSVEPGEFIAIMGPSGCGKSTLLNTIGLLDQCDTGSLKFNGEEFSKASSARKTLYRRDNIGFIFQGFNLIDDLSVLDNVRLPLKFRKIPKAKGVELSKSALERVGLGHRTAHEPSKLSGGQQQRAAIARAIAGSPKLLLADEPTGNLDSKTGEEIMDLLKSLNQSGSTIIMVTHSDRDSQYANRIVRMKDGKIQPELGVA